MIVRGGDKYSRFLYSHVAHEAEILLVCADPCRYLRKFIAERHAFFHSFPVLLAVDEKFALADYSVFAAEPRKHLVEVYYLLNRIRLDRLLPVAESGVRYPDMLGHAHRHAAVVERHLRHGVVGINIAIEVRVVYVLELISV